MGVKQKYTLLNGWEYIKDDYNISNISEDEKELYKHVIAMNDIIKDDLEIIFCLQSFKIRKNASMKTLANKIHSNFLCELICGMTRKDKPNKIPLCNNKFYTTCSCMKIVDEITWRCRR